MSKPFLRTNMFPPEILLHIFKHLHFRDLLSCTEVCRDWNSLIKDSLFPERSISLTAYNAPQFRVLSSILKSPLITFSGGLSYTRLPSSIEEEEDTNKALSKDLLQGGRINELRLENLDKNSISLESLIEGLNALQCTSSRRSLRLLSLKGSHLLRDLSPPSLTHRLEPLPGLITLDLSGIKSLSDPFFNQLIAKTPHLEVLRLNRCNLNRIPEDNDDNAPVFTQDSVLRAAKSLRLKELSVSLSAINDNFLSLLSTFSPRLRILDISICSSITLHGLSELLSHSSLENINLSSCRRIFMDYTGRRQPSLQFLRDLHEIDLSNMSLHGQGLSSLLRSCKSLQRVHLNGLDVPNAAIVSSLSQLPCNLTHLEMKGCILSRCDELNKLIALQKLVCAFDSPDFMRGLVTIPLAMSLIDLELTSLEGRHGVSLRALHCFKSLESLYLENISLSSQQPHDASSILHLQKGARLSSLRHLKLFRCDLRLCSEEDLKRDFLSSLVNLETLSLVSVDGMSKDLLDLLLLDSCQKTLKGLELINSGCDSDDISSLMGKLMGKRLRIVRTAQGGSISLPSESKVTYCPI